MILKAFPPQWISSLQRGDLPLPLACRSAELLGLDACSCLLGCLPRPLVCELNFGLFCFDFPDLQLVIAVDCSMHHRVSVLGRVWLAMYPGLEIRVRIHPCSSYCLFLMHMHLRHEFCCLWTSLFGLYVCGSDAYSS
jgi:hypothetical protein